MFHIIRNFSLLSRRDVLQYKYVSPNIIRYLSSSSQHPSPLSKSESGCTHPLHNMLFQYKFLYVTKRNASNVKRSWLKKVRKPKTYDIVKVGEVTKESNVISSHIERPDYALSGVTKEQGSEIELKTEEQIKSMRKACGLAKLILDEVGKQVQVGRTTDELDYIVNSMCNSYGAYPSPLNYRGFPKSVCTSVNNIACHGIPDNRHLKNGDIITIDVSVYYCGCHGDCAATFGVGDVDKAGLELMSAAQKCLDDAIDICAPQCPINKIGWTISATATKLGFNVVPAFCGHGIGSYFHGPPSILHYENDDSSLMQEGMIFTIEPVLCEGEPDIVVLEDGWTATTEDNSRCAQYEHAVLITKNGSEVLTKSALPDAV